MVLDRLGYPEYIGNIYEGTKQARIALNNYAETRDEVLRTKNWPFARRQITGSAGSSTVVGWAYSWIYPADCLRVQSVLPTTIPSPDYDPQQLLWTIFNDRTQSPPTKVILTQITPITINYVGQVVDPTTWEPLFVNTLIEALCIKLGPALRREFGISINPGQAAEAASSTSESEAPDNTTPMSLPASRGGDRQQ